MVLIEKLAATRKKLELCDDHDRAFDPSGRPGSEGQRNSSGQCELANRHVHPCRGLQDFRGFLQLAYPSQALFATQGQNRKQQQSFPRDGLVSSALWVAHESRCASMLVAWSDSLRRKHIWRVFRFSGSMSYPMSGPLLRSLGVLDSLWFSAARQPYQRR